MAGDSFVYGAIVVVLTVGIASLLAGEFFHGVEYLVPVGGALALLAVGGLTAAIAREPVPESAGDH
jgi:cytochrome c biogenesis protein CcdA